MITTHTDVVGCPLRQPVLFKAQEDLTAGHVTRLHIKPIVLQDEASLEALTEGEMLRLTFQSQTTQAVESFGERDIDAFLRGKWLFDDAMGDWSGEKPAKLDLEPGDCLIFELLMVHGVPNPIPSEWTVRRFTMRLAAGNAVHRRRDPEPGT